jgi:hypothetical protein
LTITPSEGSLSPRSYREYCAWEMFSDVSALPGDMHDSRLYRLTAFVALASEMALAAWVFFWQGVAWWVGVVMALGITLTLHGIFLHVFDNRERPKESIHRIKTFASLPAIFCFLVALAVVVLARYVTGTLALLLLPAFSLALWLGTLSLLILAASLFTIAHIQSWSARHAKQYRELDREERRSSAFLDELSADQNAVAAPVTPINRPVDAVASSAIANTAKRGVGFLAVIIVARALISGTTACSTAQTSVTAAPPAVGPTETRAASANLDAFIDTSGSCVWPALEEAWNTVRRELPEIVERQGDHQTHRVAVRSGRLVAAAGERDRVARTASGDSPACGQHRMAKLCQHPKCGARGRRAGAGDACARGA